MIQLSVTRNLFVDIAERLDTPHRARLAQPAAA